MFLSTFICAVLIGFSASLPTTDQVPLIAEDVTYGLSESTATGDSRGLKGRFLHITDLHPDRYFEPYTSTAHDVACHRGDGPAGWFGAETSDCDSPMTLINATFQWIQENLKDQVDFVIWTGDSARHDSDSELPRTATEVLELNEMLVTKFVEVFGKDGGRYKDTTHPTNDMLIPIIPTFGNNDILPHNIMYPGPNYWTKRFSKLWNRFIPEEQRHGFERGGWFYVEVVPDQLAIFSLNTIYFFDSNTAVDGCADKREPGYEQMDWLRIRLADMRRRGMKAIITGHVPPARTENKQSWDETCWQKYALWMESYRDVVVGSVYGHMNIDHFMLQDFKDIKKKTRKGRNIHVNRVKDRLGGEVSVATKSEYLSDLWTDWAHIPQPPESTSCMSSRGNLLSCLVEKLKRKGGKGKQSKEERYLEKIGGEWGERYALSLVSASVVPNYFPSMRVVEYNVSGTSLARPVTSTISQARSDDEARACQRADHLEATSDMKSNRKKKNKKDKKKKKKHHKKPAFTLPNPPSKDSPPGPAYSPQPFSWLGYTNYFANLTRINNDFLVALESNADTIDINNNVNRKEEEDADDDTVKDTQWHEGKHHGKHVTADKQHHPHHTNFAYEVEYDTRNDSVWQLSDLTVRSYLDLARRIGRYKPPPGDESNLFDSEDDEVGDGDDSAEEGVIIEKKKKKKGKKHKHKKKKKDANRAWFTFVRRAFVGAVDDDALREEFGVV